MSVPFISVEGPIGVGKTSLAEAIAEAYKFYLLKEIVEENPFLSKFYDDIEAWSFQTEMFFLCNRYKQLTDLRQEIVGQKKSVVADYHIIKNLIFAKRTLSESEYKKYEQIFNILTKDIPMPNIIIYIHASQNTLLKRIAQRGRSFEENMDTVYLAQLSDDYEMFMKQFSKRHPEIPILRFNGDELDFVLNEKDLQVVLKKVDRVIDKGAFS